MSEGRAVVLHNAELTEELSSCNIKPLLGRTTHCRVHEYGCFLSELFERGLIELVGDDATWEDVSVSVMRKHPELRVLFDTRRSNMLVRLASGEALGGLEFSGSSLHNAQAAFCAPGEFLHFRVTVVPMGWN